MLNRRLVSLRCAFGVFVLASTVLSARAADAKRGDLSMRFAFTGGPIPPLADESLGVNATNNGIENVVVYLDADRTGLVDTAPCLKAKKGDKAELTLRNERFEPHVLLMQTGATLAIRNRDNAGFAPSVNFGRNGAINQTLAGKSSALVDIELSEPMPCSVHCAIKPWLNGYVIVQDTPYMAKSDLEGDLRIKYLPTGAYTFRIWHERVGFIAGIVVGETKTDRAGRFTVSITEREVSSLTVMLPAAIFSKR